MGKPASINLLKGRDKSIIDKIIDWALSAGRVIVVLTELIALLAFLNRFTLDSQLTDLHTSIVQNEQIVTYFQSQEKIYRDLQERLQLEKELGTNATKTMTLVDNVYQMAPTNSVLFNGISYVPNALVIDATFFSIDDVSTFINKLKAYPGVSSVSLDRIENKASNNTLAVAITAALTHNEQ